MAVSMLYWYTLSRNVKRLRKKTDLSWEIYKNNRYFAVLDKALSQFVVFLFKP